METYQVRQVEIALRAKLHSAERLVLFANLLGEEQEEAVVNYRHAFTRWNNFDLKGVVPEDLQNEGLFDEDSPKRDDKAGSPLGFRVFKAVQA